MIELPNIRKLIIPDPGYVIAEADLSGADAQVVAWEADDADLKAAFRAGLDVHAFNAEMMMGSRFSSLSVDDPLRRKLRQQNKQAVHATNYGGKAKNLAQILGWTVHETELFQSRWLSAHPGILRWHEKTETLLRTKRMAVNAFGYRIVYFDRLDDLLPKALAWVPQSTVALVTLKGLIASRETLPWCEHLLQVHDSLVFQFKPHMQKELPTLKKTLSVPIPYEDPLIIPWELSTSSVSWGECKKVDW